MKGHVGKTYAPDNTHVFEPIVSWPFFELNREKCIKCNGLREHLRRGSASQCLHNR